MLAVFAEFGGYSRDQPNPAWPAESDLKSKPELDPLRQRQFGRPVDGCSLAAHVGFPRIAAGFAAAAGVLLAAECAADFRSAGADIHIGDTAVAAAMAQKGLGCDQISCENSRGKALRN